MKRPALNKSKTPIIVALDPAKRRCGVAVGMHTLWGATTLHLPSHAPTSVLGATVARWVLGILGPMPSGYRLITEWPREYANDRTTHKDLQSLRDTVKHVQTALVCKGVVKVYPAEWKGQVPKNVTESRIANILSRSEFDLLEDLEGDTFDAVGVFLHYTGRAKRGMVRL